AIAVSHVVPIAYKHAKTCSIQLAFTLQFTPRSRDASPGPRPLGPGEARGMHPHPFDLFPTPIQAAMHARDLVELPALVAVHSPVLIHGAGRVPKSAIEQYWIASRCRLDRWTRLLRRLADASTEGPLTPPLPWARVQPVLEEILASELLTRLWTAAAVAYDRHHDDEELAPVARNVFNGTR